MQARVDWVLIIFGTQVIKKKRPVWPVFPDYLSLSDEYEYKNRSSTNVDLTSYQLCNGLLLWLRSVLSRSLIFLNKGNNVLVLTKLPSSPFIFSLLQLHFDLIISSNSLAFLLLYLASLDNVYGYSQLNWKWHSKQCSVAPELSHFSFMLSSWCSVVLVITFFFVSTMYSALQQQFNVATSG